MHEAKFREKEQRISILERQVKELRQNHMPLSTTHGVGVHYQSLPSAQVLHSAHQDVFGSKNLLGRRQFASVPTG